MKRAIIFFLLLVSITACTRTSHYLPDSSWLGYTQRGEASYYAMKFQFRKTASGERLNNFALTAAHRKIPFGTTVRVRNLENNKYVDVIINDRGPFIRGRIIDLTKHAFSKIGDLRRGCLDIEIKVIQ